MPVVMNIPETLRLADIGVFTLAQVNGIIPAGTTEPIKVSMSVPTYWSVITERYDFGMTTVAVPSVFYYEMYYDRGLYCVGYVTQADIDNRCTHLLSARYIEPWFFNVSDPEMDILYDFSVWYYTYPDNKKQEVLDLLYSISQDEAEIMEKMREIHSLIQQMASAQGVGPSPPVGGR
jgi:hypothetical protein